MNNLFFLIYIALFFLIPAIESSDQSTGYNQHEVFDPFFDSQLRLAYRSADCQPGPGYWTNRANYRIQPPSTHCNNPLRPMKSLLM